MVEYQVECGPYCFFVKSKTFEEVLIELPNVLKKVDFFTSHLKEKTAFVVDSFERRYEIVRQGPKLISLKMIDAESDNKNSLEERVK